MEYLHHVYLVSPSLHAVGVVRGRFWPRQRWVVLAAVAAEVRGTRQPAQRELAASIGRDETRWVLERAAARRRHVEALA